ncbi:MAG: hypothetical protein ABIT37_13390 [Luteolibacter sp.]
MKKLSNQPTQMCSPISNRRLFSTVMWIDRTARLEIPAPVKTPSRPSTPGNKVSREAFPRIAGRHRLIFPEKAVRPGII